MNEHVLYVLKFKTREKNCGSFACLFVYTLVCSSRSDTQ